MAVDFWNVTADMKIDSEFYEDMSYRQSYLKVNCMFVELKMKNVAVRIGKGFENNSLYELSNSLLKDNWATIANYILPTIEKYVSVHRKIK